LHADKTYARQKKLNHFIFLLHLNLRGLFKIYLFYLFFSVFAFFCFCVLSHSYFFHHEVICTCQSLLVPVFPMTEVPFAYVYAAPMHTAAVVMSS